jgi:hypothetical protein
MELPRLRGQPALGAALFAVAFGFYAGLYALWLTGHHETYFALVRFWGEHAWKRPFLDLTGVLSWGECHRLGVDVVRVNPCDPLGRPFNYGLPFLALPFSVRDTVWLALLQNFAFLAALPFVLRVRTRQEWLVAAAASLSTATFYALERSNLDLFVFLLVAVSGLLALRGRLGRAFSYAIYFFGGMLKLYPFTLLLLVFRERPKPAILLVLLFECAIAAYVWYCWPPSVALTPVIPSDECRIIALGATRLPSCLAYKLGFSGAFGDFFAMALFVGFGVFAVYLAVRWRRSGWTPDWTALNSHYLLVGAVVMAACFFSQLNIVYRAIFLFFMIPGLFDMRNAAGTKFLKRVFGLAIAALLFCMWGEFFLVWTTTALDAMAHGRLEAPPWNIVWMAFFAGRELVWWWLMAVAFSVVLVFVLSSPLGKAIAKELAGMRLSGP